MYVGDSKWLMTHSNVRLGITYELRLMIPADKLPSQGSQSMQRDHSGRKRLSTLF
jgi:hypothetical protein